jgi:hypothetical protein
MLYNEKARRLTGVVLTGRGTAYVVNDYDKPEAVSNRLSPNVASTKKTSWLDVFKNEPKESPRGLGAGTGTLCAARRQGRVSAAAERTTREIADLLQAQAFNGMAAWPKIAARL